MGERTLGLGIDIVEISRIAGIISRRGTSFLGRIYTPAELDYAGDGKNRHRRLAGRWAAKEAVRKTLGPGLGGVAWQDVEVLPGKMGEPRVHLHGHTGRIAADLGATAVHLSISHSVEYAVAVAMLVAGEDIPATGRSPIDAR